MFSKCSKRLKLEKQLEKGLENHFFAQIMDWFECIKTTFGEYRNCQRKMINENDRARSFLFRTSWGVKKIVSVLADF